MVKRRLEKDLLSRLETELESRLLATIDLFVGSSRLTQSPKIRFKRALLDAIARATQSIEAERDEIDPALLPARALFDPERPIPFEELREQLVEKTLDEAPRSFGALVPIAAAVAPAASATGHGTKTRAAIDAAAKQAALPARETRPHRGERMEEPTSAAHGSPSTSARIPTEAGSGGKSATASPQPPK